MDKSLGKHRLAEVRNTSRDRWESASSPLIKSFRMMKSQLLTWTLLLTVIQGALTAAGEQGDIGGPLVTPY